MTPAAVISHTACIYGLSTERLTSRDRCRLVSEARSVAAFLAYELTGASYEAVGAALGGRTKQTVSYLVDGAAWRLQRRDGRLSRMVAAVERAIG